MYIPVLDWYGMEFLGKVPYTGRTQAGMVKKSIPDQHWYVCTSLHLSCNIYIYGYVQNVQMDFQYRSLAKQMMIFEKNWVIEWAQTVNQQATFYLKQV